MPQNVVHHCKSPTNNRNPKPSPSGNNFGFLSFSFRLHNRCRSKKTLFYQGLRTRSKLPIFRLDFSKLQSEPPTNTTPTFSIYQRYAPPILVFSTISTIIGFSISHFMAVRTFNQIVSACFNQSTVTTFRAINGIPFIP